MQAGGGGFSTEGVVVCQSCILAEGELSYRDLPSAPAKPKAAAAAERPLSDDDASLVRTGVMVMFGLATAVLGTCGVPGLVEMIANPAPVAITCEEAIAHGVSQEWVTIDRCELGAELAVLQTLTRLRLPSAAAVPLHAEGRPSPHPRLILWSHDGDLLWTLSHMTRGTPSNGGRSVDPARFRRVSGMLRTADDIPDDAREHIERMSGVAADDIRVLLHEESPGVVFPVALTSLAALCLLGVAIAGVKELRARGRAKQRIPAKGS